MARSDSTIRVNIIGDASKLTGSLKTADSKLGTFGGNLKTLAIGAVGVLSVAKGFELIGDSLENADRHQDALTNLGIQLTPALATRLDDIAGSMTEIGLSKTDFDTLATTFADFATSTKELDVDKIAALAPSVVATAQAVSLLSDSSPAEVLGQIEKAAGGSEKAARLLGVTIDADATFTENLNSILEQLKPKLDAATSGSKDLEAQQKELNARWDNASTTLGEHLVPLLSSVVGFINDEIDAIPGAIAGWQLLGAKLGEAATPLARIVDLLGNTLGLLQEINKININDVGNFLGQGGTGQRRDLGGTTEADINRAVTNRRERNGLGDSIGGF